MELVSKIDLVGGVLLRRAFENSRAANASALAAELMVRRTTAPTWTTPR